MAEQVIIETPTQCEIWLPVQGYESFYHISNLGRVKALAKTVSLGLGRFQFHEEIIMSPGIASNGYRMVRLQVETKGKTFTVHRLVALHFVPNPDNYKIVNHIDGNKLNCAAINLEWGTYSHNAKHAYKLGLRVGAWTGKTGKNHHRTKPLIQYDLLGSQIKEWESSGIAAIELGIKAKCIRSVCGQYDKTYKGSRWAYKS